MENVLLVNLSRQMAMRRTMDVVANNLANMNTTAFKAETVLFQEKDETLNGPGIARDQVKFVMDFGLTRNAEEGPMEATANPLDLAISGEGYFAVRTPDGERYTRNGHFSSDADGRLVTREGFPVLDDNGQEIVLDPDGAPLSISSDGAIEVGPGEDPLRLMIVRFDEPAALRKTGTSLFETDEDPKPADGPKVLQGMLERSNVSPVLEMTRMIQTMRAYQTATQAGQRTHDLTTKAIERLGRLQA